MHADEETLRALYAAWNGAGVRAAAEYLAEDVVMYDFPELPDASVTRGREECIRVWEDRLLTLDLKLALTSTQEVEPDLFFNVIDIAAEGADTGIHLRETHIHVTRMRDGQVVEMRLFRDEAQAREAAGLPPAAAGSSE